MTRPSLAEVGAIFTVIYNEHIAPHEGKAAPWPETRNDSVAYLEYQGHSYMQQNGAVIAHVCCPFSSEDVA